MGRAAVYSEAKKALGGIDILINNAGAYEARLWFETTPEGYRLRRTHSTALGGR